VGIDSEFKITIEDICFIDFALNGINKWCNPYTRPQTIKWFSNFLSLPFITVTPW